MDQMGSDAGTRSTEWMSNGDCSAVHIAVLWVQSKSFSHSQELRGKSLIHLCTEKDNVMSWVISYVEK